MGLPVRSMKDHRERKQTQLLWAVKARPRVLSYILVLLHIEVASLSLIWNNHAYN